MAVLNYYDETNDKYIPLPIGSDTATYGNYKYNTDEQVIGEWINGKPLYRRIIRQAISGAGSREYYMTTAIPDCENYWVESQMVFGDNTYSTGAMNVSSSNESTGQYDFAITSFTPTTGRLWLINGASANSYLQMIINYTKTTDEENSFSIDMLSSTTITASDEATDDEVASIFE